MPAFLSGHPTVKCLLVDDMDENLLALEGLLRRDGLEILTATSGAEALELLLVNDFALAILDVQMPGMDGFELAELMRWSVRTRNVPIIFLTAGGLDERRKFRGYETGAVDFLFKPIEPSIMQGKAEVFFGLYSQRQEVVQQRDALRSAMEDNARLYERIVHLNESLEERVQERTTQLIDANELLQGFTNSIAHDFRQHIRNIGSNARMAIDEERTLAVDGTPRLERIIQVTQLMDRMTEDLLSYARNRNAILKIEDIDLTALAKEVAGDCRANLPLSQFQIAEGLFLRGDRTMIRIVMENLLDNAFKFSRDAADPLVEVGRDADGFFVRDNGIGFDMKHLSNIFKPFAHLPGACVTIGSGMGLANVKRILDRHNGKLSVISLPGKGTAFHFSI